MSNVLKKSVLEYGETYHTYGLQMTELSKSYDWFFINNRGEMELNKLILNTEILTNLRVSLTNER